MLHIVLWKWRDALNPVRATYEAIHVNVMARMLSRNMKNYPHRIICITDDPWGVEVQTFPLWTDCDRLTNATKSTLPSCYRRLKLYDPETQRSLGILEGDRIMGIDIDGLIQKEIVSLIESTAHLRYVGWAVHGPHHPKVFNGSLQMFHAGDLSEIWSTFEPKRSPAAAKAAGYLGSDQSWLSMKLAGQERCDGFIYPTVASYSQEVKPLSTISDKTHITFFNGRRKPWHPQISREAYWVKRYWH